MTIREYLDDHDTEEPDDYVISLTSMVNAALSSAPASSGSIVYGDYM